METRGTTNGSAKRGRKQPAMVAIPGRIGMPTGMISTNSMKRSAIRKKDKHVGFGRHPQIIEYDLIGEADFRRYNYKPIRRPVDPSTHATIQDRKLALSSALRKARLEAAAFGSDDLYCHCRRYEQKRIIVWDTASDEIRYENNKGHFQIISKQELSNLLEEKWSKFMILTDEGVLIPMSRSVWVRPRETGDMHVEADETGKKDLIFYLEPSDKHALAATKRARGLKKVLVGDTGCGHDLLNSSSLTKEEKKRLFNIDPVSLNTANGEVAVTKAVSMFIRDFDQISEALIMDDTPEVFSIGRRCSVYGYKFIWDRYAKAPILITPDNRVIRMQCVG